MLRTVYSCDVCKIDKGETNHWYVLVQGSHSIRFMEWNQAKDEGVLHASVKHLCGQACCHRILDEFLGTSKAQEQQGQQEVAEQ